MNKLIESRTNDAKKYIIKHTSKKTNGKSKILLEIKESLRILENYVQNQETLTKIYFPGKLEENDNDMKIYEPKIRIKK